MSSNNILFYNPLFKREINQSALRQVNNNNKKKDTSYLLVTFDVWKFGRVPAAAAQMVRKSPLLEVPKRGIARCYVRAEGPRCRLWSIVSPGAHFAGCSLNITSGKNVFD